MVNFEYSPNKTARISLDTNAKLEPRSNLDVAFSTADQDTAILKFIVTQDRQPLFLGESNIESNIYLKHSNGSNISHPLTITDGLHGELAFQLPNDFVKIPGQVTAQVYIARKGEKQAIVAERIFNFTIQKSLAWEFDSETKLGYIIEFNELRELILNRQKEIEDAQKNGVDYVAQLEKAREKGLSDIEISRANSIEKINTLVSNKLTELNNKGTSYINQLDGIDENIDKKINQFNSDVSSGGYVKGSDTSNWQKHKFTNDDGSRKYIPGLDLLTAPPGLYETTNAINGPLRDDKTPDPGFVEADITVSSSGRRLIMATRSSFNRTYIKAVHTNGYDTGWKELTNIQLDTGWVPLTLKNNYKKSTIPDFAPSYRVVDNGNNKRVYIRLGVENLTNGKNVVSSIPPEFAQNKIYGSGVSTNSKIPPKVIVTTTGDIEFHTNEADSYSTTDYIIYQDNWIV